MIAAQVGVACCVLPGPGSGSHTWLLGWMEGDDTQSRRPGAMCSGAVEAAGGLGVASRGVWRLALPARWNDCLNT